MNGVALEDDKREEFNKIEQVFFTNYRPLSKLGCVYSAFQVFTTACEHHAWHMLQHVLMFLLYAETI